METADLSQRPQVETLVTIPSREILRREKNRLLNKLKNVDEILKLLETNPSVMRLVDLLNGHA